MPYPVAAVRNKIMVPSAAVQTYSQKVLATASANLLVYFICGEASGTVMQEEKNNYDGAYTGVTLGETGIGDGNTCPWWDAANDYGNIYTAGLAGVFNGAEGTMAAWFKMNSAAVWADGVQRYIYRLSADSNNRIDFTKQAVANTLRLRYIAGAVDDNVSSTTLGATTAWFHLGLTWSVSADQVIAYINGVQDGATLTGLGTWAGALGSTVTVFGAATTVPASVHHGWGAHPAVWSTPLSASQMLDLATV